MNLIIHFPVFAVELLKRQQCPFCRAKFVPNDLCSQGHRRAKDGNWYYFFESLCHNCGNPSVTIVTSRPVDTQGLGELLAEVDAAPTRGRKASEVPDRGATGGGMKPESMTRPTEHDPLGWHERRSSLNPTKVRLEVEMDDAADAPLRVSILGAYASADVIVALYRCWADVDEEFDGIATILRGESAVWEQNVCKEHLLPHDWITFSKLVPGKPFRLGGQIWKKLSTRKIADAVAGKRFPMRV